MKSITILASALLLCFMMLFLAGCVSETTKVSITENGGEVVREWVVTKRVYDLVTDYEDFGENIERHFYTENGTEYCKLIERDSFYNLGNLSNYLKNISYIGEDSKDSGLHIFQQLSISKGDETLLISGSFNEPMKDMPYSSCKLVFIFDGKIIANNVGELIDDNTIEIDILNYLHVSDDNSFAISVDTEKSSALIYVIVGSIILVLAIFVFVLLKRKKRLAKNQANAEINITNNENGSYATNTYSEKTNDWRGLL